MKRLLFVFLVVLSVFSVACCGSSSGLSKSERNARKAAEEAMYVKAIKDRDFTLEITQIIPHGFPSRTSQAEYYLTVKGDVVNTRLPYMGDSHYAVMGGEDISIVFEKEKVSFMQDFSDERKGEYRYSFTGCAERGSWKITLQLYNNGRAHIGCFSPLRGTMSYVAEIKLPSENE